jgi:hypothetical protein
MAMERGHHQIAADVYAVAECIRVSGVYDFTPVAFTNALPSQPVVISSIVTNNENDTAILRMKDLTNQGFYIAMQEQESNAWNHAEETVCFIAMEKWSGVVDDLIVEVGATENGLTDRASTMSFEQQFSTIPFVLADMQTTNGSNPASLGMSNLSVTDTTMTIVEEQSEDIEVSHTNSEVGGYFAIAPVHPEVESAPDAVAIEDDGFPADTNNTVQADPIVTEDISNQAADETVVTTKSFNKKTMSSLVSLYTELIYKTGSSKKSKR